MTITDEAAEYAAEFHGAPAAVQGLMKRAFMFGALSALTSKPPSAALCRLRKAEEAERLAHLAPTARIET